jgi:hypothetical protein
VIIEVNALKFTGEGIAEQTDSKNCISGFAKPKGGCRSREQQKSPRGGGFFVLCCLGIIHFLDEADMGLGVVVPIDRGGVHSFLLGVLLVQGGVASRNGI